MGFVIVFEEIAGKRLFISHCVPICGKTDNTAFPFFSYGEEDSGPDDSSRGGGHQNGASGSGPGSGGVPGMVSRRKILSRSRDDLHMAAGAAGAGAAGASNGAGAQPGLGGYFGFTPKEEEDVWYQKEKLYRVSASFLIV